MFVINCTSLEHKIGVIKCFLFFRLKKTSFLAGMWLSELPKASSFKVSKVVFCLHGLFEYYLCSLFSEQSGIAVWHAAAEAVAVTAIGGKAA